MKTYERSGVIPATGVLRVVMIAGIAAILLGTVYSYAVVWIPLVKARFLLTLGFGAVLGGMVGWAAKGGHIRNLRFVVLAWSLATFLGFAVSWFVWPAAMIGFGQAGWRVLHPGVLLQVVQISFQQGNWGVGKGGGALSGWPLVVVWLIEATAIFVSSYFLLRAFYDDQPYCEQCLRWTETQKSARQLAGNGQEPLWDQVRNGRLIVLNELPLAVGSETDTIHLDLIRCPQCGGSKYLTARCSSVTIDKKGNSSTKETPLVTNLVISDQEAEFISLCGAEEPVPE